MEIARSNDISEKLRTNVWMRVWEKVEVVGESGVVSLGAYYSTSSKVLGWQGKAEKEARKAETTTLDGLVASKRPKGYMHVHVLYISLRQRELDGPRWGHLANTNQPRHLWHPIIVVSTTLASKESRRRSGCCSPASQPLPRRVVSVSVPVPFCCARRIASKHTVVLPGTYERASHYPHSHSSLSPSLLGEPPSWYSAYALSDVLFCFPAMMHARDIDTGTCDMAAYSPGIVARRTHDETGLVLLGTQGIQFTRHTILTQLTGTSHWSLLIRRVLDLAGPQPAHPAPHIVHGRAAQRKTTPTSSSSSFAYAYTLVAAPPRPGLWGLKRMDVNGIGLSLTPPTPDSESRRADTVGDTVYINPSPLPPPNSLGGGRAAEVRKSEIVRTSTFFQNPKIKTTIKTE
ncbi:hypothetical protein V8E52_006242 [Russula decolorans]